MLAATRVITGIHHTLPNMSATSMDYANNPMVTLPLRTPRTGNLAPRMAPHTTRMIIVRATIPRTTTRTWLPHRAMVLDTLIRTVTEVLPMATARSINLLTVPPTVLPTVMARSTTLRTVLPDMATLAPISLCPPTRPSLVVIRANLHL